MNLSIAARKESIMYHLQDAMRLAGYERLELEYEERPSNDIVRIYTRGKAHPCDAAVRIGHSAELVEFMTELERGIREEIIC